MVTPDSGSITRHRLNDQIASRIREEILSGALRPGTRMVQSDWADRLGTSRMPVRDAFLRLQSEGLIEIRPRSGTFVSEISPREVRETFEVRAALECLAVELAIGNLGADKINRLKELVNQMEAPVNDERGKALHEQKNEEFHSLIVFHESTGNAPPLSQPKITVGIAVAPEAISRAAAGITRCGAFAVGRGQGYTHVRPLGASSSSATLLRPSQYQKCAGAEIESSAPKPDP